MVPVPTRPGWFERSGLNTLLLGITGVASYWAAIGWGAFAKDWLGMEGPERYLVFGLFECTAAACILMANRARLIGDGAGKLWALAWVIAGLAVAGQLYHSLESTHPQSALVYCTASALAVLLWQIKANLTHRDRLRRQGRIPKPLPGQSAARWLLFRRSMWRALTVAAWLGITEADEAVRRAGELYPAGLMPWEKAHQRAARRSSGGRWFARKTATSVDGASQQVMWPVLPAAGATVLPIVSARPAETKPQPQAKPVAKATPKRPVSAPTSGQGGERLAQVRTLRTLDDSLEILRLAYPSREPSHREVFTTLGINSKSQSADLKKLIRAELANGREPAADDDKERSA